MDTQSESLKASGRLPSGNVKGMWEAAEFEVCLKAAEQGRAAAQYNLGVYYLNGHGVAKDEVEAAKWCLKAAEQGHAAAQYNLGVHYENGRGVAKDEDEAAKWYRKAAEQGDEEAVIKLRQLNREYAAHAPTPLQIIYDKAAFGFAGIAGIAIGIGLFVFLILVLMEIFGGSGNSQYEDPWNEEPMLSPR